MVRVLTTVAALLFVTGGTAFAAPGVEFTGTLSTGTKIQLNATGNPLKGSGTASAGTAHYALTVTSVSVSGNSVIFEGSVKGEYGPVSYKLIVNKTNGNFSWTVNGKSMGAGHGSIHTHP